MFGHNIRIFCVVFHPVILQDQGPLFTAFGKGQEKINPVFWYLPGVLSPDVYSNLELGDDFDMLSMRFHKSRANQKVV